MEQITITDKRFASSDAEFDHYLVKINGTDVRAHQKKDGNGFGLSMKDLCKALGYETIEDLKQSEEWEQLNQQLGTANLSNLRALSSETQEPTQMSISTGYSAPAFWAGGTLDQAINLAENPYREDDVVNFLVTHSGFLVANQALIRGKIESNKDGNRIIIDPDTRSIKLLNNEGTVIGYWSFSYDYCKINMTGNGSNLDITPAYMIMRNNTGKVDISPGMIEVSTFESDGQTEKTNFSINYMNETNTLKVIAKWLPTSAANLEAGQIWNDNGTLKIK